MGKVVCGNTWMRWSDGWFVNVEFSLGAGAQSWRETKQPTEEERHEWQGQTRARG